MNGRIDRGCLRCGKENYVPAGKIDNGPAILAYCIDCVKLCTGCGQARKLGWFWPDKTSAGWVAWRATSRTNVDPDRDAVGDELGTIGKSLYASDFLSICKECQPYAPQQKQIEVVHVDVLSLEDASTAPEELRSLFEAIIRQG